MKKRILTLMLAVLLCMAVFALAAIATETESTTTPTIISSGAQLTSSGSTVYSWELDSEGTLTFYKGTSAYIQVTDSYTSYNAWRTELTDGVKNENYVKTMVFSSGITQIVSRNAKQLMNGYPNLETINIGKAWKITNGWTGGNFFDNNPKLTTIMNGHTSENNQVGTVNLEKVTAILDDRDQAYMFRGCSNIKKVVFSNTNTGLDGKYYMPYFSNYMFSGCTSLESVNIPAWVTTLNSNIFKSHTASSTGVTYGPCPSIKSLTIPVNVTSIAATSLVGLDGLTSLAIENPDLDISALTIPNNEGLVINCASATQVAAIVEKGLSNVSAKISGNFLTDGSGYEFTLVNDVLNITKADTTATTTLSTDLTLDFVGIVKTVIISEDTGVTAIGANMFDGFAAETVVVPSTLKTVGAMAFANMPNLKTVVDYTAYAADNTAGSGIINIMTATSVASDAFSGSCSALSPVVYMGKTVAISGETFDWFAEDATETICVYPSTKATTFFRNNSIAFSYLTVEQSGDALLTREDAAIDSTSGAKMFLWSFDEATGKLTVTPPAGATDSNNTSMTIGKNTTGWQDWKAVWKDAIISFYLVNFGGYRTEWQNNDSPFSNLTNLKHVHFGGNNIQYRLRKMSGGNGLFENCTSLTTVSYGSDDTYDEVIDLGRWTKIDSYMTKWFYNCSSIKKIIFPKSLSKASDGNYAVSVTTDFFNGCSSLTEVDLPAYFIGFGARAFDNCPNLTHINYLGDPTNGVNVAAFPDRDGLVIDVISYAIAKKFDVCGFTKTVVDYPFSGIVSMEGFNVRLTGYNGLRGLFTSDLTKKAEYESEGYKLLEFGGIVGAAKNRANCVLVSDGNGAYTTAKGIVRAKVWNSTDGLVGKYLSTTTDANIDFAVTVVRFAKDNYMSDVYFCSYEIWQLPGGETEIIYKDYAGTEYDEVNLAELCNAMWEDGVITEEMDTEGIIKDAIDYYEENRAKNILFIGNSFTYYNSMPTAIFPVIAEAGNRKVNVTAITNSGHTLTKFASSSDAQGANVVSAFANNSFDYVILQEQSTTPIRDPESFYSAVRTLKEMARKNGAKTYLYATWGYDADHANLSTYGKDTADMEMKLRAAYEYIGEELNIPVCHVGAAMTYAFTNSDISLYNDTDNYHPKKVASTLAALTIFSTIYGIDPATIDVTVDGVSADNMAELKTASSYVYNGDMSVPESYKTSSSKPLDGKRIIFIGNSHLYYGNTVLYKNPATALTQSGRMNDQGYFYQLCKANGMNVNVTNWTFSNHVFGNIFGGECNGTSSNYACAGVSHESYLVDPYYDYVVACYGTTGYPSYSGWFDHIIEFFKEANPNVNISLMAQSTAHGINVRNTTPDYEFLDDLKEWADKGVNIIDWGKLVADLISGEAKVPGTALDYNMNTFVVMQSASDGFHPNQLTGYITTLMTYSMLTGESAVGQPYYFVGDDSYCTSSYYRTFEEFKSTYYTYNGATTNYDQVFASESDMLGIQTLIDTYIEEKPYEDYAPKRAIFIGDSFVYYGNAVLDEGYTNISQTSRERDNGYFYQLCKANGIDVNVTNWTFGGHGIGTIRSKSCTSSSACGGVDHMSYLKAPYYDYVIISGGRASSNTYDALKENLEWYMDYFKAANPNVKFFYLVSSGAHNISVAESFPKDILNNLDKVEELGFTVIDWGKLVADIINGEVEVPGATQEYNKNSFVVCRSSSDGYHPNQLAGYLTSLMTYIAITGESAVGQPYDFCGDTTVSPVAKYQSFADYVEDFYTYNGATTNYPEIFASSTDMTGLQTLVDQYFAAKDFRNYDFQ